MAEITKYRRAGYPAVCVETLEPLRTVDALRAAYPDRSVYQIAAAGGLKRYQPPTDANPYPLAVEDATCTFPKAFAQLATIEQAFLIVLDFQHVINNAPAYRPLLDAMDAMKARGSMAVLIAPTWQLPAELAHELPILRDELPTSDDLAPALDVILEATKRTIDAETRAALLLAARGLTRSAAENAFALAALNGLDPAKVEREKMRLVKSRALSIEAPADPATLGGLTLLREYITAEVIPAQNLGPLAVRGLLLVGVPGTGKSLTAKIISAMMHLPLVRLDIGAAKGSLVGESEATLRNATNTVDAVAPCVLWIDEIEKGVGGYASSAQTDGGTTLGMIGHLLTWLQEHTSPVLVVATCNDYSKLPPELTRAGRFDESFFIDIPNYAERAEIAAVHLRRFGIADPIFPARIAAAAQDFTGAEIEQLVKSAARRSNGAPTTAQIELAAADIRPIARRSNIKDLRAWASANLRAANAPLVAQPTTTRRID